MPSGYYYFGGYDMTQKEITVLMVEPGKHPKGTALNGLDFLKIPCLQLGNNTV